MLEAVADDAGVTQFDMFAEGMSAPYALTFAAQEPGRVGRIVVWSGFASGQEHFRNPDYRPYLRMDPEGSGGTTQYAVAVLRWAYGKGNGDFGEAVAEAAHGINPESLYAQTKGLWEIDASPLLADIQAPVLVLHRESCPIAPLDQGRKIAARVPHARLTVLPGDSWAPFLPEPGPALGPISEFLGAGEHPSTTPADSGPFRTLLFTDVVASTPLLVQLKDERMRAIMRDHDAVLQAAVDAHGGRVVKTIRDAFMADFAVPSAAVECAIAMQRGIRQFADSDVPIRLRIGINAGEPIAEDDDLHGASVVIAKRLESAAPTDGILVSDVVQADGDGQGLRLHRSGRSVAEGVRRAGAGLGGGLGVGVGRPRSGIDIESVRRYDLGERRPVDSGCRRPIGREDESRP